MEKISSLIRNLSASQTARSGDKPLTFSRGDDFSWDETSRTISYNPAFLNAPELLLHEFGHAALGHKNFARDIDLLTIERDAWAYARAHADEYDISIDEDVVEDALDTYRDWLHNRSLCPVCASTGIQLSDRSYECIACRHTWRANDARTCALRRYDTKKRP